MIGYQSMINGQQIYGQPAWNANGSLATLWTSDPYNSAINNATCNYTYDDLSRVSSVNCGANLWSQTFSYDRFGNISKSGSVSFQPTYDSTTNRMTSIAGLTPTYDNNGNVTYDGLHHFAWNVYRELTAVDSTTIIRDAFGRVAETDQGSTYSQFRYDPSGALMELSNPYTEFANVPGITGVWQNNSFSHFKHFDWLGSSRVGSTYSRGIQYDAAYAPFGETFAEMGTLSRMFAGIPQDISPSSTSGLYDASAREYPQYGRWISPDPAGMAAVDPTNPQTWNRYAYVANNPSRFVDPLGLGCPKGEDPCPPDRQPGAPEPEPPQPGTQPEPDVCFFGCGSYPRVGPIYTVIEWDDTHWRVTHVVLSQNPPAANTGTISAGTLDQLNDYCSARGRAKFVADWLPGGATIARTLWGSHNGDQLGFYQLSTADLNNITGENSGGQTVAMHAASEGLKAAAGSTAFLSWFRGATGVPKTLASTWLGRLSIALIVADASSGFYKEGKEILNCQAGN
jgi:RHS repeat-associated protein